MAEPLFHLITSGAWQAARSTGTYRPDSLTSEGFIHFSYRSQVAGTRAALYADVPDLVVLEIDPELTGAVVRVEDSYGSGTEFPHLYGPLPVTAVVAVRRVEDF